MHSVLAARDSLNRHRPWHTRADQASSWAFAVFVLLTALIALVLVLQSGHGDLLSLQTELQASKATWDRNATQLLTVVQALQQQLKAAEQHRGQGLAAQAELEEELRALREELHSKGQALEELQSRLKALQQANATAGGASGQGGIQGRAMVIVEPRNHTLLQLVLENFHANMPPSYDLYIFHGRQSAGAFHRQAAANVSLHRRVVYVPLDWAIDEPQPAAYNRLLKDPEGFWGRIDAENILLFQTDSVLCAGSPWRIHAFEHLGYIGCAYGASVGRNNCCWGEDAFWGVGGLSFRKKSIALACLASLPHAPDFPEDIFFSNCVDGGGGRHAESGLHLSEFCSQTSFLARSFGAHSLATMDSLQLEPFLLYCPEARPLAPYSGSRIPQLDAFEEE